MSPRWPSGGMNFSDVFAVVLCASEWAGRSQWVSSYSHTTLSKYRLLRAEFTFQSAALRMGVGEKLRHWETTGDSG